MKSLTALSAILLFSVSYAVYAEDAPATPAAEAAVTATLAEAAPAVATDSHDADHDGVSDDVDKCLQTPQIKKVDPDEKFAALFPAERRSEEPKSVPVDADGCALDTDKDGVPDHADFCPQNSLEEISAGVHTNGCPLQSDADGTPDYRDNCPDTPRGTKTDKYGCPK